MILLIDVGNTNIKIGLSDGKQTVNTWRIATDTARTADETGMILFDLLRQSGRSFRDINGVIISSVVPNINYTLEHMCSYYLGIKPVMVSSKLNLGKITIDYPGNEIGSDRLVNAVAGFENYGGPIITVDFGTATTFGVIDANGVLQGGLIAPGIKSSAESLVNTASKLPRIELIKPANVIGKNTVENMQAGIIYGFAGLVEYIIKKIKSQPGFEKAKVIATGGMSQLITDISDCIDVVDRALSLKGLQIIYELNKRQ